MEKMSRELGNRSPLGALRTSQFRSRRATNDEAGSEQFLVAATAPGSPDTWVPQTASCVSVQQTCLNHCRDKGRMWLHTRV